MGSSQYFYGFFAMFLPESFRQYIKKYLRYAGIFENVNIWVGRAMFFTFSSSFLGLFAPVAIALNKNVFSTVGNEIGILPIIKDLIANGWIPDIISPFHQEINKLFFTVSLPFAFFVFVFVLFLHYLYLFYRIQDRTERIEGFLPDFLYVVVSNLQAGMVPYAAFVNAAKPEFGPLEEEVRLASSKVASTQSLVLALRELSKNINSDAFRKIVALFEKGVMTGGKLAPLLMASADEMKRLKAMEQHMVVSVRGYVVFLGFIIVIIAPFLFSIGKQFLATFIQLRNQVPQVDTSYVPVSLFTGDIVMTPAELQRLILLFLGADSLLISLFIGTIQRGNPLYGIKYAPLIFFFTVVVFFISSNVVSSIFEFT